MKNWFEQGTLFEVSTPDKLLDPVVRALCPHSMRLLSLTAERCTICGLTRDNMFKSEGFPAREWDERERARIARMTPEQKRLASAGLFKAIRENPRFLGFLSYYIYIGAV